MKKFIENNWAALLFVIIVGLSINSIALLSYFNNIEKRNAENAMIDLQLSKTAFKEGDRIRIFETIFVGNVIKPTNKVIIAYIKEMASIGVIVVPVKWDDCNAIVLVPNFQLEKIEKE